MPKWLRITLTLLGCLSGCLLFPAIVVGAIWLLILALNVWPSAWCLFAFTVVALAAIPALIMVTSELGDSVDRAEFLRHPIRYTAIGGAIAGALFAAWIIFSLSLQLTPLHCLIALAVVAAGYITGAVVVEVHNTDAIQIKGLAGKPGSKLGDYLNRPATTAV